MTYNAALDESGKHGDCEVVVFGGLIFNPKTVDEFNCEWRTALQRGGVPLPQSRKGPFLHTSELSNLYARSSNEPQAQERIRNLAMSLAMRSRDFAIEAVWNIIGLKEFSSLTQLQRKRYKDPFFYAFEAGILHLAQSPTIGPEDDIALICDDSDESPKVLDAFRRMKRKEKLVCGKIPVIAFGDDSVYPPLQAADLLAYCGRCARQRPSDPLWSEPFAVFLSKFAEIGQSPINADSE